jgi:hypothetical protein
VIKQVLILVGAAATTAGVVAAVTLPGEAQQRTAYVLQKYTPPVFDGSYTAGMRIIHVPQARAAAAPSTQSSEPPSYSEDDNDAVVPAPRPHKQVSTPQPRRVLPPADAPKRTVLKAPNDLHDGPSPTRPLPRWRGIEKFTEPSKPASPAPVADAVVAPIPAAPESNATPTAN